MANKEFKIQSDTVSLNGVPLSSSTDGKVVIPGVTRATGYRVEEVNDTTDQTRSFQSAPVIIDYQIFLDYFNNGSSSGRAVYTVDQLDGDGYIDGISVDSPGAYTSNESNAASRNDMWAYIGTAVGDEFNPFVDTDWDTIPFRPKMRSTGIESDLGGGGTGAGVVQRTVNFPQGEDGDTAGTIALTPGGAAYMCMQDYVAPENLEFSMVNTDLGFSPNSEQRGASFIRADNSDLDDFINNIVNSGYWDLSWIELSVDGGDTWFHLNGYYPDTTVWGWEWLTTELANNPGADTEFQLRYTPVAPSIWQQLDNGTLRFNNHLITTNRDLFGGEANVGIFNDNIDLWNYNNTDHSLAEVWLHNDDTSAPRVDINVEPASQQPGDNLQTWSFKHDGSLVFPDGSIQTTAYTGQSSGTSGFLYVMGNIDGTVVTSTDGLTWSEAVASGMSTIGKMEVHGGVIVYTRADVNDNQATGLYYSTVVGTVTLCPGTDSWPGGSLYWREVHYFDIPAKWVAVGYYNTGSKDYPVLAHSTDGINWTFNGIDQTFADGVSGPNNWRFNDVAYNPVDNVYVIVGQMENNSAGAFTITDLTAPIDGSVWNSTPPNLGAIVNMNVAPFGPTGFMIAVPADGDGTDDWSTSSPVADNWSSTNGWYDGLAISELGYAPDIAEIASDGTSTIATTNDGQVIARGLLFGPTPGIVSIPLPYTSGISDIVRNQSGDGLATTISFNGYDPARDGEKITITGVTSHTENGSTTEQSYNGTYYIKTIINDPDPNTYELYLDNGLTQPWDTSTYWPVDQNTGTLTWSHGQYLDAAGVAGNTFFVGNDDEQVFKSTDAGLTWTQVQDVNGAYFNDFAYGTFGSASTFAGDGALVLPLEDHIGYRPFYSVNGPTLKLRGADSTQQVIITGPEPTDANRSSQRLVIQGQRGFGNGTTQGGAGEGGDVYIWGGVGGESNNAGGGSGGDIKVRGGVGQGGGTGGYVKIEGGDVQWGNSTGGYIDINAGSVSQGDGGTGDGGDVNIRAGTGTVNNGEVHVWTAGSNNHWVFKNDGSLQLPDGSLVNGSELTGNGLVGSLGSLRVVYTNYNGYQGGESTSLLVKSEDVTSFTPGDTITFRNGEVRTITVFDTTNWGSNVYIEWTGDVEGGDQNPRYPVTITTADFTPETKLTARIKPDSQTVGTGQYMDIYVGGATVVDNKHVHMAGHDADTELFLGTDNNFVSAKEAGASPARVNLQSENDITVSDTNLRMSRGNTWLSVYGDGVNRNQHNSAWDLAWNVITTDDQGNSYVGGESMAYAEAMVAKYGPDGDLIWNKMVNGDDISGWKADGVAYNPVLKEVAVAVQTNDSIPASYYKINTLDSETGDFKSSFNIYDADGHVEINNMTWHPTLGYVAVGYTHGEFISSSPIPPVITSYSYTTATSTSTTELTITDNGSLPAQEPQIGDTVSFNGGIYTIETVTAYSTYYGITAHDTDFGVPDPGTAVILHRGPSALDIIELPVNAVKIGGQWPNINDGSWFISGTNIVGNQTLQGGVGLYYAPVINLTNPTDTGLTVGINIDYSGGFYNYLTTGTSGTGVWGFNDEFRILGSNLGGIDAGTNVSGTVSAMTQADANAYAFFTKVDHPDLYNQLNACSWTVSFNTNTYNVLSCVESGDNWAVLLQDCTDLTPSSMLFYTLLGNDIVGLVADQNGIQNGFTGTPNVNGLYRIDMAYMGGYNGVDFTGGTFTITTAENNRAFVWTPSWSKVYHPAVVSGTSTAYSVTVQKSTGDIIVGGIDTGAQKGFVWKLDVAGTTSWISVINDGNYQVLSVAVSELTSDIYYTSPWNSVNKLNSSGGAISRVEPSGPWGMWNPILMLEQGLDGVEYVYVAGAFGSAWTTQTGFLVNKLTSDFKLVWTRDFYSENRPLNSGYDKFNNQVAMGRDKVIMVGYTNVGRVNNSNAFIASISTTDTFDAVQLGEWHVQTPGGWVGYEDTTTNYEVYNAISNGATVSNSSLTSDTGGNTLTWTNWGWKSTVLKLDKTKSVTGVETIHFAEGGDLDHNPSDIPPVLTDFNSTGWNYTLKLSDRGKFIINEAQPGNGYGDNLNVYIPSNTDVNFPVGTVITLINTDDVNNHGYRIFIEPTNYGNSNAPRVFVAGVAGTQGYSRWSFQGIQTATLMKIGSNEWLLTANNITNEDA